MTNNKHLCLKIGKRRRITLTKGSVPPYHNDLCVRRWQSPYDYGASVCNKPAQSGSHTPALSKRTNNPRCELSQLIMRKSDVCSCILRNYGYICAWFSSKGKRARPQSHQPTLTDFTDRLTYLLGITTEKTTKAV